MTVSKNRERGFDIEDAATERWPLQIPVDGRDERNGWYDLEFTEDVTTNTTDTTVVTAGTKAEAKSCYARYDDRNGRWWIRKQTHEQLVDVDGQYVLAVIDRDTEDVLRMGLTSARTVDAIIDDTWWDAGEGGQCASLYRQLAWTTVFESLGGEYS